MMSDKENEKLELDANALAVTTTSNNDTQLVATERNSVEVYSTNNNAVTSVVNNNMMINNQNSSSTNISFEGCNGVQFGNMITVIPKWPVAMNAVAEIPHDFEENIVYKKTPTIKAMMESNQRLNDKYLDIFCAKLGHQYQAVSSHLKIDELDIKQALEDHKQYGTSEVLFQILSKYFQNCDQYATVGWLTRFLWVNKYKPYVWAVKELWKLLNEIELELSREETTC